MMDRRLFLKRAAMLAAGVVAVDQLEILERLAPKRLWAGADFTPRWGGVVHYADTIHTKKPYGVAWASDGYLAYQFKPGEPIAIVRDGALVSHATVARSDRMGVHSRAR